MAWAIAVCIDLTCVMAARERQRDKRTGRRTARLSWPTAVLVGGIGLSLAANLAQAEATVWGWITAGTPAGAFLVAVSMLERRATATARRAAVPVVLRYAVPPSFGVPSRPHRPAPAARAADDVPALDPAHEVAGGVADGSSRPRKVAGALAVPPGGRPEGRAYGQASGAAGRVRPPGRRRAPRPTGTAHHPRRAPRPARGLQPARLRASPPSPHRQRRNPATPLTARKGSL